MSLIHRAAAAALGCASTTWAADHVVAAGSSIQSAIETAASGDRILILPGTYPECLDLRGKLLELRGVAGPVATTIDGTGFYRPVVLAVSGEPYGTLLAGLTLHGGDGRIFDAGSQGPVLYGGGLFVGNGSSLRAENCVLDGNGYTGLGHIGSDYGGGLYVGRLGSYCELYRCLIVNNFAWVQGGAGMVDADSTLRVEHCSLYNNSSGNLSTPPGGFVVGPGAVLEIVNTISWNDLGPEIGFVPGPGNGALVTVAHSDMQGGWPGTGNFSADPGFLNPAASDFHISSASPCVDTGDAASTPDADGTRSDVGAYPYLQSLALAAFCSGDGSGSACPCGNQAPPASGAGCRNSTGGAALLAATGRPWLSNDTLTLHGSGMPPTATGLFFQGTSALGGLVFGDGQRCAGGTVRRLAVRTAAGGASSFGEANPGDARVSFAGGIPPDGAARLYQLWYRDAATFCTAFTFNLTNGLRVLWSP